MHSSLMRPGETAESMVAACTAKPLIELDAYGGIMRPGESLKDIPETPILRGLAVFCIDKGTQVVKCRLDALTIVRAWRKTSVYPMTIMVMRVWIWENRVWHRERGPERSW